VASWSDQYICKRNWLDWEGGIISILYCDCESVTLHNSTSHLQYSYSESYGAWKLFCCIIAKYIWGIAVVRGSGMGQDCGKLPNMVNQQKYLTRTEMVYSSKNGMVITTKAYQAVPARKNYPFKNSMFCCKPELQTSNFPVMKLDEVVSNSQNLSQSKN